MPLYLGTDHYVAKHAAKLHQPFGEAPFPLKYGETIRIRNEELTVIGYDARADKIMVSRNNGVRATISRKAYQKSKESIHGTVPNKSLHRLPDGSTDLPV